MKKGNGSTTEKSEIGGRWKEGKNERMEKILVGGKRGSRQGRGDEEVLERGRGLHCLHWVVPGINNKHTHIHT